MSSYGWGEFGEAIIAGVTYLFVAPLIATVIIVGLVSGGFALWQHNSFPLLLGLVAVIPTYIVFFFAHYYYWKYRS